METVNLQATFYNIKATEQDQNQEHKWTEVDRSTATIRK